MLSHEDGDSCARASNGYQARDAKKKADSLEDRIKIIEEKLNVVLMKLNIPIILDK